MRNLAGDAEFRERISGETGVSGRNGRLAIVRIGRIAVDGK
jgi:hypothetical protein